MLSRLMTYRAAGQLVLVGVLIYGLGIGLQYVAHEALSGGTWLLVATGLIAFSGLVMLGVGLIVLLVVAVKGLVQTVRG